MANKLRFSDNCIEIECDRGDADTLEKITQIYPIHSNRIKTKFWTSPRNIVEVLRIFRGITQDNLSTAPPQVAIRYTKEMRARLVVDKLLSGEFNFALDPQVSDTLKLKHHQELGREIALARDRFCFFYDTRTGKTPLSLSIIYDDLREHPTHKWLVVCPLILIDNAWLEDANKFFPDIKTISLHAATPKKRAEKRAQEASIYVTNVESFANYQEDFEKMGFHGCIVDESSTMKSYKSKTSDALVDFAQKMKRFYLLSGTPAPNGEWEYYMQLKAIDYYGVQQSYTQFEQYYFIDTSFNSNYKKLVVRPDRKDELMALIKKYSLYVDKEDVLTTPGRTWHEVEFELPEELKKQYTKMKNDLVVELNLDSDNTITITAPSAAAKLNKLNQITSGFIMDTRAIKENAFYDDSNLSEWYLLDNYRFKRLEDLLMSDDIRDKQVLIWANYRKEFEIIQSLLGERCRCVYGGTSINEKNEAIRLFKSGEIQYLIANPASADKGLTLTNAHICIYFSLNWSYELFKQSMERIYGDISKQPEHCHYYVFIAKGTIDRILYSDVLQGKGDASYAVLNHLKGGAL